MLLIGGYFLFINQSPIQVQETKDIVVDMSNWNLYKNSKYGYEFKYPTDYVLTTWVEAGKTLPATPESYVVTITKEGLDPISNPEAEIRGVEYYKIPLSIENILEFDQCGNLENCQTHEEIYPHTSAQVDGRSGFRQAIPITDDLPVQVRYLVQEASTTPPIEISYMDTAMGRAIYSTFKFSE